jgi:hypothetical protein
MALLTALSIALRAFLSDSFFAISQSPGRHRVPQLGILQGLLPSVVVLPVSARHAAEL